MLKKNRGHVHRIQTFHKAARLPVRAVIDAAVKGENANLAQEPTQFYVMLDKWFGRRRMLATMVKCFLAALISRLQTVTAISGSTTSIAFIARNRVPAALFHS